MKWLFDFRGRATRLTFWRMQLVGALYGGLVFAAASFAIMGIGRIGGALLLLLVPALVFTLAVTVRRLHDRRKSGWWLLVFWLAPTIIAGVIMEYPMLQSQWVALPASLIATGLQLWGLVEMGFVRGSKGNNRFGPDLLVS